MTVGQGKRLFAEGGELSPLHLLHSQPTSTGMLLLTYGRAAAAQR